MKTVARGFNISPRGNRAAMVTYGSRSASLHGSLGVNSISSTEDFLKAVSSLKYGKDRGNIREALRLTEQQVQNDLLNSILNCEIPIITIAR